MSFKRKGAPSAKSLDFSSSDPRSGAASTNKSGQVIEKPTVMNWPYQRFTTDNELNPRSNQAKPDQLSNSPQAFGDYTVDGGQLNGTVGKAALGANPGSNGMLG